MMEIFVLLAEIFALLAEIFVLAANILVKSRDRYTNRGSCVGTASKSD